MREKVFLLLIFLSLTQINVYPQKEDEKINQSSKEKTDKNNETPEEKKEEKKGWGIGGHPIFGYDDDTRLTLGAGMVIYYEPGIENQEIDEIDLTTSYNWAKQYDLMMFFSKYFEGNKWFIEGESGYQNYPDDYKGEEYAADYVPFEIGTFFRVSEKIYIGPQYNFKYSEVSFNDKKSKPAREQILGTGRMYSSGLGSKAFYKDTPTGQIYRREGNIITLSGVYYSPAFLSSSEFTELGFDYRRYYPAFKECVVAFQIKGIAVLGDAPFHYIPSLENKQILRGGSSQSGKYFLAGQTEFRFPLIWRIGATVFLGTGETVEKVRYFGDDLSIAGGFGLRITLNRAKNITMRFDIAFNEKGEKSLYIKIKEAF